MKHVWGGGCLRAQSPATILMLSVDEGNHSPLFFSPPPSPPPHLCLTLIPFTLHMMADSKSRAELFSLSFRVMFFRST